MLPRMMFGSTGHESTRTLFGAAALGSRTQDETDRTMELLIERGVNHIDTAASYGDSEERLGPWMKTHRDQFFLASKTEQRTYDGAKMSLERSLTRMRTDTIDLVQMHFLVKEDEWQTAYGKTDDKGALAYLREAKEQGLVRFIGVTGHGLNVAQMHERGLTEYDFDSILLPWNYPMSRNPEYAAEFAQVRDRALSRGMAVQTIKSIARGPWGDKERTRDTWYEPLETQDEIDAAVFWLLSHPTVFLNTVGDIDLLPRVLDAAERFAGSLEANGGDAEALRPSDETMSELVASAGLTPLFVE